MLQPLRIFKIDFEWQSNPSVEKKKCISLQVFPCIRKYLQVLILYFLRFSDPLGKICMSDNIILNRSWALISVKIGGQVLLARVYF